MKKNPIDKDKIALNPHSLEYGHSVGSAVVKPLDKGRIKGLAVSAMYEQTDLQLQQIKEQVDLLAQQAKTIQDRVEISEKIYLADCGFKPLIGKIYHLYEKSDKNWILSMIAPEEWGDNCPYHFVSTAKLLADHTWEIIES
ncbi:DUF2452 domain-containing protein [Portibacter lacus]|uniref:DUF2452 domain-containing protein n=1 Tax=Portibacter lacus TaxID=1099794 RepID=A0AA37WF51_9BACT|nr:DUF2452 domain-containing protein [Portibacter lacus]GLR17384.1 hypothetical protein GCM10007940_19990 [Portibacter lacus]